MENYVYEVLENGYIQRTDAEGKTCTIPNDPANSDYQRYLNAEAEQSTPIVTNGD